jgi:anti-sigma regulatory factor (Ser/Thr protein kinase)
VATAATATAYTGTFHGTTDQVSPVRREVARHLGDCPVTDDAVLVASELATNAILYSRSRGQTFTIRVELHHHHVRVECHDSGGPWRSRRQEDRPHGLHIVETLTGPDSWGVQTTGDGNRIVWAQLTW